MNIESEESINMKIVGAFFEKSKQTYLDLLQFIKQYSEITRDYNKKMKNLHSKFVGKLTNNTPQNPNDNLLFLLTGRLLKVLEIQSITSDDLLIDIESFADKGKKLAGDFTESISNVVLDYKDSVNDLQNKYKEIEKVKKDFFADATNVENFLIKQQILKKHSTNLGGTKDNNNEIINTNINKEEKLIDNQNSYEENLNKSREEVNSTIYKMKESEKNYRIAMKRLKNFEESYTLRAEAAINSSITTNVDFAMEIKERISGMLIFLKNIAQVLLTESDTYLQEIDKFTVNEKYEEIIRNSLVKDKPLKLIEQEPYRIKLLSDYNSNKPIENKEITEDDIGEIIQKISENLSVKKKKDYNIEEEKKHFDFTRITNKFITHQENGKLSEKDESIIKRLIDQQTYRVKFLQKLTELRTKGTFQIPDDNFRTISKLLYLSLNTVFRDNDFYTAKNVIILSQTFYHMKQNKKIYLQKKLLRHPIINENNFWKELINYSLSQELNNLKKNPDDANNDSNQFHLNNLVFSQLLPLSDNMFEFGLTQDRIKEIITPVVEQYHLDKSLEDSIYGVLNRPSRLIDPGDFEDSPLDIQMKKDQKFDDIIIYPNQGNETEKVEEKVEEEKKEEEQPHIVEEEIKPKQIEEKDIVHNEKKEDRKLSVKSDKALPSSLEKEGISNNSEEKENKDDSNISNNVGSLNSNQ